MSLVYSEPFLYRSLDFQISSSVLLYERLLLVLASAAYGTKPLEVYSLPMACGTDFIRNMAARDKFFGLATPNSISVPVTRTLLGSSRL